MYFPVSGLLVFIALEHFTLCIDGHPLVHFIPVDIRTFVAFPILFYDCSVAMDSPMGVFYSWVFLLIIHYSGMPGERHASF